jgi:putative transposase
MARISRVVVPDYPHHITQRGVRSMTIFGSDADRKQYLAFIAEETDRFAVAVHAWCLMINHVHFIATPQTETGLARAFGEAHRRYTRMKNFSEGVRGYLFQGRFGSTVLDERHLLAAARYIELNPVRAKLVVHAWEYPWSSARYHVGLCDKDPLVEERELLKIAGDWKKFLRGSDEAALNAVRTATRTGHPAGDARFIKELTRLIGRQLERRKPGRPRRDEA